LTVLSNQLQFEIVLVKQCVSGDRKAQHKLYNLYAGKMYAICMRYANNQQDAQDILQDGFIKVFVKLNLYKGEGSLEGWIRRIMVFACIDFLRKRNRDMMIDIDDVMVEDKELTGYDKISMQELLTQIQALPNDYRMILNLFMVEGFTHKEISEMLSITESSSKARLSRAKVMLQKQILAVSN
jgi:RNA polymerase sigma factor (sigma-70 family)